MQVKKFEAPTMQEALKTIKRELGPEAIILSTKHLKSGFGLMSKASVEVTAAIAEKDLKKKMLAEKGLPEEVKEKIWNKKAEAQGQIYDDYFEKQLKRAGQDRVEINAARSRQQQPQAQPERAPEQARALSAASIAASRRAGEPIHAGAFRSPAAPAPAAAAPAAQAPRERRYIDIEDDDAPRGTTSARATAAAMAKPGAAAMAASMNAQAASLAAGHSADHVRNLEREMEQLRSMVAELATAGAAAPASSASSAAGREENDADFTDELVKVMHDLVNAGVEKKLARQLVRNAAFDLSNIDKHDDHAVLDKVAAGLIQDIQTGDLLETVCTRATRGQNTVLALVGPTGVGKTTTIAKIASLGILERRLRVGLINLDSYKVAAADQLATYAKIMNVPFRSVNSQEELNQAIFDFSSLDLVLIDTTGRSQKDQESLLQLRHMLNSIEGLQSALLVSATTKDADLHEVVSRFQIFSPAGLVLSKLDETSVYGCLYNVQKKSGLPLLYFTVGQRVPEDIEKASAERVAALVLNL
jgi:flagellar biosynthesis protein FlhF